MYAVGDSPEAKKFNCTQRGHQNSLETLPSFLALLLVAGARYPVTAAIAGVVYNAGKIVYFNGYASGDPSKRMRGAFSYFGFFTLIGAVVRAGLELLSS
jgi:glutathione S-transferase